MLELIFRRVDPRGLARVHGQAFLNTLGKLAMHPASVQMDAYAVEAMKNMMVCQFRCYRMESQFLGVDVSHGLAAMVLGKLGVSSVDLEDQASLLLDDAPLLQKDKVARWKAYKAQHEAGREAIQKDPAYQALLARLPPQVAVHGTAVSSDGRTVQFTNAVEEGIFKSAEELFEEMAVYKTMAPLLFLSVVAPEDRLAASQFIWEIGLGLDLMEGKKSPPRIFKLIDRNGQMGLFLMEAVLFPGQQGPMLIFLIERCPVSRHITPHPHYRRRAQTFKEYATTGKKDEVSASGSGSQSEISGGGGSSASLSLVSGGGGGGGGGRGEQEDRGPPLFPGLAVLPMDMPLPEQEGIGRAMERTQGGELMPSVSSQPSLPFTEELFGLGAGKVNLAQLVLHPPPLPARRSSLSSTTTSTTSASAVCVTGTQIKKEEGGAVAKATEETPAAVGGIVASASSAEGLAQSFDSQGWAPVFDEVILADVFNEE
jgi:uncharacterized membrane protein YgcG